MLGFLGLKAPLPIAERRTVMLSNQVITYTLKRTARRKSIGLKIDDAGLTVSLPSRASERWLQNVLQEKADWIIEKLSSWQSRKPASMHWIDGQYIKFLGEPLTLRVVASLFEASPLLQGKQLFVFVPDVADQKIIAAAVECWYRQQADLLFRERVTQYAEDMKVKPSAISLTAARTQWGSCTANGIVRLNWQLIRMPLRLIDYVVVHELAHLIELNHSAAFWQIVQNACPDYARCRAELRSYSMMA